MDPGSLAGESDFVGAFAQSNEGDVSPNINGPHCIDTGIKTISFVKHNCYIAFEMQTKSAIALGLLKIECSLQLFLVPRLFALLSIVSFALYFFC